MFLGDFFAQTLKPFKKGFRAQELSGFGPKGLAQRRGGPHDGSFLVGRKFGFNLFDYRYADAIQFCVCSYSDFPTAAAATCPSSSMDATLLLACTKWSPGPT